VLPLLVTDTAVSSLPILFTLMIEALSSSETSVPTRATWRNIPEDAVLYVPIADINNAAHKILVGKPEGDEI
jgi:hypothetical protein